jgi:hypothetical protein
VVSMLASGSRVRGFKPGLPSEGKSNNLSHVPTFGHVKNPNNCSKIPGCRQNSCFLFPSFANRGLSRRLVRSASGDDGRNYFRARVQSAFKAGSDEWAPQQATFIFTITTLCRLSDDFKSCR